MLTYNSELAREKMWARIHLIPALQAEEDRDQVRRYLADKAREKELLGSETKVYNTDRYVTGMMDPIGCLANELPIGSSDQPLRSHQSTRRNRYAIFESQISCGADMYIQVRGFTGVEHRLYWLAIRNWNTMTSITDICYSFA
jgi:hypothetical protein